MSQQGRRILRGELGFDFREIQVTLKPTRKTKSKSAGATIELSSDDDRLLARLKALRLELARARKVPAYVVFSDSTLAEIASTRPSNLDGLSEVNGVGPKKLQDYGETFLSVVNDTDQ